MRRLAAAGLLALGAMVASGAPSPPSPGTAEFRRAVAHLKGEGAPHDAREGARQLLAAARKGHVPACYLLGRLFLKGTGVRADREKALLWLRKAADQGHPKAKALLARLARGAGQGPAMAGSASSPRPPTDGAPAGAAPPTAPASGPPPEARGDPISAEEEAAARDVRQRLALLDQSLSDEMRAQTRQRADAGSPFDLCQLGWMHETGAHAPKDRDVAREYYQRALEKGYPLARVFLRDLDRGP